MPREQRGQFITPYRKAILNMIEDPKLRPIDMVLLLWLVFAVDPGTRRLEGVTLTGLAEHHRVDRKTMRSTLARLRNEGYVDFHFERRTTGWVKLTVYDRIMHWTPWMAEQRRKAVQRTSQVNRGTSPRQRRDNGESAADSAGKTSDPFLTLLPQASRAPNPSRDGPNDNEANHGEASVIELADAKRSRRDTCSPKGCTPSPAAPSMGRGLDGGGSDATPEHPRSRNDMSSVISSKRSWLT